MMSSVRRTVSFLFAIPVVLCILAPEARAQEPEAPPYIPTGMPVVWEMLSLAGVDSDDLLYDLGSGDGRIVIAAAQRFGTRGIGYEIVPELVEHSREAAREVGVSHLTRFVTEDLFAADLRPASVVTLYLGAEFNLRLRPILLEQLRPGTRVVSHAFHMGEWDPDTVVHVGEGAAAATVYMWVVPADLDGFWQLDLAPEGGSERYAFEILQEFQQVGGQARREGRKLKVAEGRIDGERIRFTLVDESGRRPVHTRFSGEVRDGTLTGTYVLPDGTSRRWRATRFTR